MLTSTPPSTLFFPFVPARSGQRIRPSLVEMIQLERVVDAVCDAEAVVSVFATAELAAVAEHARAVEPWLRDMAAGRGIDATILRRAVPRVFERDTLVLLRQGLVHADDLRGVADDDGDVGLGAFCTSWLARRRPLVEAVDVALRLRPT